MILDYTIITHVAVVPLQSLVPDFIFLEKKNPKIKIQMLIVILN